MNITYNVTGYVIKDDDKVVGIFTLRDKKFEFTPTHNRIDKEFLYLISRKMEELNGTPGEIALRSTENPNTKQITLYSGEKLIGRIDFDNNGKYIFKPLTISFTNELIKAILEHL